MTKIANMTDTQLTEGINHIILSNNQVFANVSEKLAKRELLLDIDSTIAHMNPVQDFDLSKYTRTEFSFNENAPLIYDGKTKLQASINGSKAWMIDGLKTLQVKFPPSVRSLGLACSKELSLPASKTDAYFNAKLAIHRAEAALKLHIFDHDSQKTVTKTVAFDPNKRGGKTADKYQDVKIELPSSPASKTLKVELFVNKGIEQANAGDSYIFMCNPHISSQRNAQGSPEIGSIHLANKQHKASSKTQWLMGHLPKKFTQGSKVSLVTDKKDIILLSADTKEATIHSSNGHEIVASASQEDDYAIFIDGNFAGVERLDGSPRNIRVPRKFFKDYYAHIAIKDQFGLQCFAETFVLLPWNMTPVSILQQETQNGLPASILAQTPHRYESLKAHLGNENLSPAEFKQLLYALEIVENGHKNVELKPLKFPVHKKPEVSVIIPAHNKVEVTYLCLCSLLIAQNTVSFEVIVVNDGSEDETTKLDKIVKGITVHHNKTAERFIKACNKGVSLAKGKYVVLLNNDTEVTQGWLDELVESFSRFDNVGLAGSKLLYPNGELQDAGGIIWSTGNPWNYGRGISPQDPRVTYARQADYLSGAAMMTTKKIWDEVGGLSSYLEPMYFEDTDFAFKIRDAGYKTYFVPSSIVYHYEGMTSGRDVTKGYKRFQEINRPKFKEKWHLAFKNFSKDGDKPDLEKDRGIIGRILFIDYATPRPDMDAGSFAAIQEIKLIQSMGYKVSFIPTNMAYMGKYTEELQKMGVETIYAPFFLSVNEYLEKHASEFDSFYITRYYVAQDFVDQISMLNPNAKIIFNNADLHFLRELRSGLHKNDKALIEKALETKEQEISVIKKADVTISYNYLEHSVIQSHSAEPLNIHRCPWVVDIPKNIPTRSKRKNMSFLGSFRHFPNKEGLEWFSDNVMNRMLEKHPDIHLDIYGSGVTEEIKTELNAKNVMVKGFIEDVAEAYNQYAVFVSPLLSGAGMKGKVLGALAYGIPSVISPISAEGIGLRHEKECLIVETPDEYIDAIIRLYNDNDLWSAISKNSREFCKKNYSFAKGRELMIKAFRSVDLFSEP